jgi:hypothetical protein
MKRNERVRRGAMKRRVLTAAVMLSMLGCTPEWARRGDAQFVLLMTGINDGAPISSDVRISSGTVCADLVPLRLENHSKNANVADTSFRADMTVERYEVRYFRSDGRNQQGVDVPYTITGNLAQEIRGGEAATLNLEVVRRQAKLEPPLVNLRSGGGAEILTVFAEVTLHARMTTLQTTNSVSARMQIDFADFADTLTSCP